ncbi:MAG TPA: ribose-phosphate pyrophosphokinase [Patescibacteria group bacterium]|jgi:ribose-phosphate pyrophosphokinase|nr:ribose-phosphate pyrophosphokinase [Patescibacteria group bacterium]
MLIFGGSLSKVLASRIAKRLNKEASVAEVFRFPDGEKRIRIRENVLDQDCVIVHSTALLPDEAYMEVFIMVDALKRSGAKSVTVAMPYMGYSRQDHVFRDGEDVSLEVMIKLLEATGVDKFIAFDLHSIRIPELFSIPVIHLSALPIFAEKIKKEFKLNEIVLVSPDMGGIRRIKEISEMLGNIPYATIEKNRDLVNGEINDSGLNGDVRGKIAVIVDDMISTGITMVDAAELLVKNGAIKVFAYATHAVFSKGTDELLQKSKIEKVVVSDTIVMPIYFLFPKLEVVSIAEVAAEALKISNF